MSVIYICTVLVPVCERFVIGIDVSERIVWRVVDKFLNKVIVVIEKIHVVHFS